MGGCISCLVGEAVCCCAQQTISCCCFSLNNVASVATRSFYTLGFILASIFAWFLRIWGSDVFKPDLNLYCNGSSLCWGILAVYRVSLAMVIYHGLLCVLTIGVQTSAEFRAAFHNRFWPFKFLLWAGLITACFFIPASQLAPYGIAAIVFSVLFILIQTVLLVDLAHSMAEWILERMDESGFWKGVIISITVFMFSFMIVVSALLYHFFSCPFNNGFVSVNLILCIVSTVVSILPRVVDVKPTSGLLQPSILAAYTTYLIASAISSEPASTCGVGAGGDGPLANAALYTGIILTFVSLAYSAFSTGSSSLIRTKNEAGTTTEDDRDDEADGITYNYSYFHFVFVCAAFYMCMVLSNWRFVDPLQSSPSSQSSGAQFQVDVGIGSTWVKIATSWVVHALYVWTLIAPMVFPDRDFS